MEGKSYNGFPFFVKSAVSMVGKYILSITINGGTVIMKKTIETLSRVQANMMDVLIKYTMGELTEEEASDQMDKVVEENRYLETVKEDMDAYYAELAAS